MRTILFLLIMTAALFSTNLLNASMPIERAVEHFEAGRLTEARTGFESILENDPQNHTAHYYMGRIALQERDLDAAIERLSAAVRADEGNSTCHGWLGRAYIDKLQGASFFEKGTLAGKAMQHLETAIELDADNVHARICLANYYLNAPSIAGGSKKKAKAQIEEIMKREPAEGYALVAMVQMKEKRYEQAIESFDRCIEVKPDEIDCYYFKGMIYQEMKQYDQAFETFELALAVKKNAPGPLYQIGRTAVFARDNIERGIQCLQTYLMLDVPAGFPGPDGAHWRIGMLYEIQGDRERAQQEFALAVELNPAEEKYRKSLKALASK